MFRPPCDSIIFDLDGTLWDASPTSAIAWSKTANDLGIDISIDEAAIKKVSGLPFDKCVDLLFGSHAEKVPNLRTLLDESEKNEILQRRDFIFYTETLGFKPLAKRKKKSAYVLAGDSWVALVLDKDKDAPEAVKSYAHIAFSVNTADFNSTSERIRGQKFGRTTQAPESLFTFLTPVATDWRYMPVIGEVVSHGLRRTQVPMSKYLNSVHG
jgi:hypothetical protein